MIRRWNTRLARQLWAIRRRAIRAGERLLSEDEIDREVAERQGTLVEAEPMMKSNRGLVAEAAIGAVIIALLLLAVTCLFMGGCAIKAANFQESLEQARAYAAMMEQAGVAGVVTVSSTGAPGISVRNDFLFDTSFQVQATIQANAACAREPNP